MALKYADRHPWSCNHCRILHVFVPSLREPSDQNPLCSDALLSLSHSDRTRWGVSQLLAISWLISLLGVDFASCLRALFTSGLEGFQARNVVGRADSLLRVRAVPAKPRAVGNINV